MMKKIKYINIWVILLLTVLCFSQALAWTDEENLSAEGLSEVKMTVTAGGKEMNITAVSGMMDMETDLGTFEIFYTAYTADDAEDPSAPGNTKGRECFVSGRETMKEGFWGNYETGIWFKQCLDN